MNLDKPATHDNLDDVTWNDIRAWAAEYLPPESAYYFTHSMNSDLGDWGLEEDEEPGTIRNVLITGYREWIGADYPNP